MCAPKSCGGLGIGSLQASNIVMLSKWWWRFYTENNPFWRLIITSIHGRDGGLGDDHQLSKHISGPWKTIISLNHDLSKLNIDMSTVFVKQVGDGSSTRFWHDVWLGNSALKNAFPRIYLLETNRLCSISERCLGLNGPHQFNWAWRREVRSGPEEAQLVSLVDLLKDFNPSVEADSWKFTINTPHIFSVSGMRKHIDIQILDTSGSKVRWNKNTPIKINIFAWRLIINRLPTHHNLDLCGVDLDSILCPVCNEAAEIDQHLFLECEIAQHLWKMVLKWWGLNDYPKDILGMVTWVDSVSLPTKVKPIFDAVVLITNWAIWRFRNSRIFDSKPPRKDTLEAEIKTLSFSWITYRNRKFNLDWNVWIYDPILACNSIL